MALDDYIIPELRAYQAEVDSVSQPDRYTHRVTNYENRSQPDCDVVIAGAGPAGLSYGLFMQQNGLKTKIITPHNVGQTTQAWNISQRGFDRYECILSSSQRQASIDGRFEKGYFAFHGFDPFITTDVLNLFLNPKTFLKIMAQEFQEQGGQIIKGRYDIFANNRNNVEVFLTDKKSLKSKLFLPAMGVRDQAYFSANKNEPTLWYTVYGVDAEGDFNIPDGDIIRTIGDAVMVDGKPVQLVFEHFKNRKNNVSTIYLFVMSEKKERLSKVRDLFWKHYQDYTGSPIKILHSPVYGYIPLPLDIRGKTRSMADRVRAIGENDIISSLSGCGVTANGRTLEYTASQLVTAVKTGNLSHEYLNTILPDPGHMFSLKMLQLFSQSLMVNARESLSEPNRQCGSLFNDLSYISDTAGANRMLQGEIEASVLAELAVQVVKRGHIKDVITLLDKNNPYPLQIAPQIVSGLLRLVKHRIFS